MHLPFVVTASLPLIAVDCHPGPIDLLVRTYEAAESRVLLLERDVLGGAAAGLEFAHHQAELGAAQERVHVRERRRRHRRRVALQREVQTGFGRREQDGEEPTQVGP